MKLFSLLFNYLFCNFFLKPKVNFINEVRDKFGNSEKSYSVKMKSVTKESSKNKSIEEKKSKKYDKKR